MGEHAKSKPNLAITKITEPSNSTPTSIQNGTVNLSG